MHTRTLTCSAIAADIAALASVLGSDTLAALPCGSPLLALAAWLAWRALQAARADYGLTRLECLAWGAVLVWLYPLALLVCCAVPTGTLSAFASLCLGCFPLTQALALLVFHVMIGAWVLPRAAAAGEAA
jgi:hypothetical protein